MISQRIQDMSPSATSGLLGRVADKIAAGADIVKLNAGEPDYPTPDRVVEACIRAIREGKTKYTGISGIAPLREAICRKLSRDNDLCYASDQIVVSTGAKHALYNAVMAVVNPGDEVIIPIPAWVSYVEMVKLAGGRPVLVQTRPDYSLDPAAIKAAVTDKTAAVIINTPNNPTGAVYDEASLRELAKIAIDHDLIVISDEVYEKLVYGRKHISIASLLPEMMDRTIVINGLSKAFSMTGWRLGYSASTRELAKAMTGIQGHISSNSTTFVQYAAIEALEHCDAEVEQMRRAFEERRNYMYERLNAMPGISCSMPQGAFYFMPDFSAYIGKTYEGKVMACTEDLCEYLLERSGVAVVFGEAFYMPNTIRFAYSNSMEEIAKGMDRLEEALARLS